MNGSDNIPDQFRKKSPNRQKGRLKKGPLRDPIRKHQQRKSEPSSEEMEKKTNGNQDVGNKIGM